FSSRVENYIKYRPRYPLEIIDFMKDISILSTNSVIADIGSGTGILSELLIKNGKRVYGVEPNAEMRIAAEKILRKYPNFVSINGSAENTGLQEDSIDLITAGQSFHWFNLEQARKEFKKILKSEGYVAIIWNNRRKSGKGFSSQYEKLVSKYGTDYKVVRRLETKIDDFFCYKRKLFYNYQDLNFDGLKGRLLSASYIPLTRDQNNELMLENLRIIFDENQQDGKVRIEYDTEICYGQLD
ncbi:MAG: class I SAM-dependent methyltransferase, partial [Promethearchaeota archaeon]